MPDIKLKLQDNPKYFSFSSKDYFEYPYYDGIHTLPARCKLSFQSRLQSNGDADDESYTLGQIFIRKYGMYLDYSPPINDELFVKISIDSPDTIRMDLT